MTEDPRQVKTMLGAYGRQLTFARRLARFRRAYSGEEEDAVAISRQARRRDLVERISREIVENLLSAPDHNPVLREIMDELENDFGQQLTFAYPLPDLDLNMRLQIFKGSTLDKEVSEQERQAILNRLWQITLSKVDETML